jgi:hypothetical protein
MRTSEASNAAKSRDGQEVRGLSRSEERDVNRTHCGDPKYFLPVR